jgi:hypothetical protein
VNPEAKLEVL